MVLLVVALLATNLATAIAAVYAIRETRRTRRRMNAHQQALHIAVHPDQFGGKYGQHPHLHLVAAVAAIHMSTAWHQTLRKHLIVEVGMAAAVAVGLLAFLWPSDRRPAPMVITMGPAHVPSAITPAPLNGAVDTSTSLPDEDTVSVAPEGPPQVGQPVVLAAKIRTAAGPTATSHQAMPKPVTATSPTTTAPTTTTPPPTSTAPAPTRTSPPPCVINLNLNPAVTLCIG